MMSIQEWVQRVRELLQQGKFAAVAPEVQQLREGLLAVTQSPAAQEALTPELTTALTQLATALASDHDALAPLSDEDRGMQQMVADFRPELVALQQSLEDVLTPNETAAIDLALELADGHCEVRQFDSAMRLLQQVWHRTKEIDPEARAPAEPALSPEDAKAATQSAGQALADVLAQMQPLSNSEQLQCAVYANMLNGLLEADQHRAAIALLTTWTDAFDDILKTDEESRERREAERKAERERLEKERLAEEERIAAERKAEAERLERERLEAERMEHERLEAERLARERREREVAERKAAIRVLADRAEAARDELGNAFDAQKTRLQDICSTIGRHKHGQPFALETEAGTAIFNVQRFVSALAPAAAMNDQAARAFFDTHAKARLALQALKEKADAAQGQLDALQRTFTKDVADQQKLIDAFVDKQQALIDEQEREVASRQAALDKHILDNKDFRDHNNSAVNQIFGANARKFYGDNLAKLKAQKKLSAVESQLLKTSELVVAKHKVYDTLQQSLTQAKDKQAALESTRDEGQERMEDEREALKLAQDIRWATPADIVYGTPLGATQLDAVLSAGNGTLSYFADGRAIVSGSTVLAAGDGQELRAVAQGGDTGTYRATPDKTVRINVKKATCTLQCKAAIVLNYGAPLRLALLEAGIATTPPAPDEHAEMLRQLVCSTAGQVLPRNAVLDAGDHVINVTTAAHPNVEPAPAVTVALTVHPAQQEVVWEGAAPTMFTYEQRLVATQLNARVRITTDPPLADRLDELTQRIRYADEDGKNVSRGALLPAGDARTVTATAPALPNFAASAPRSVVFQVQKATRTIESKKPLEPIGAVLQADDLKQIAAKFRYATGSGTLNYHLGPVQLKVGAALPVGDKQTLRAVAVADDNYLPTTDNEQEVDVVDAQTKSVSAKAESDILLAKKVHTKHKAAIDALRKQIDDLGAAATFEAVSALVAEVREIEERLVTWQGPVPSTYPQGDAELLRVASNLPANASDHQKAQEARTNTAAEALKLVKHGGMRQADVENLVPAGTGSSFGSSGKYPKGFKYEWDTPSGVHMEVYGHGPTVDPFVAADSDNKKGNLVRVRIDGAYLCPDGTLTANSRDATSHMALY